MCKIIILLVLLATQPCLADIIINPDGTATDTDTGLMWGKQRLENCSFRDALYFAHTANWGNYRDWRVPSYNEMLSIIDRVSTVHFWISSEMCIEMGMAPYWCNIAHCLPVRNVDPKIYNLQDLENAKKTAISRWDIDGDFKVSLPDIIHSLQVLIQK